MHCAYRPGAAAWPRWQPNGSRNWCDRKENPTPAFPRPRIAAQEADVMLVDSHCHLNYEGTGRTPAGRCWSRAREAGVTARVPQHLHSAWQERGDVVGTAEREPTSGPASAFIRTRPSSMPIWARAVLLEAPSTAGDRHRREAGSTITTASPPRGAAQPVPYPYRRVARETGLPLIVHTRDAEDDTAGDHRRGNGEGRFPGADPLLHRIARLRARACWSLA